jgi:hypothetical protein
MSRSLSAVAIIAAISLGALVSQVLPRGANAKQDRPLAEADAQPGEAREQPPAKSSPRHASVPLQHAILRDEKEDSAEAKIAKALDSPTTVEFLDLPLEDCLTFLKEYHGINIWLDKSTLTDEGVALDQPVTLKLAGVRLESILNLLLEPIQLDWIIQDEVLKITTRAWAEKHPEIRTYDVQNLIDAGHAPEDLMASITKCTSPNSWTAKGATAGISHTGGVLVIRQSQRTHAEIGRLLAELDDIAVQNEEDDDAHAKRNAIVSVRVYHTGEQSADKLAECVQDFVAFTSWTNRGGEGKVRALNGALVVEQTADVHQAIQQFLAELLPRQQGVTEGGPAASAEGSVRAIGPPRLRSPGAPNAPLPNRPGARDKPPALSPKKA